MNRVNWEDPIPITYENRIEFPLNIFPKWIKSYVEGVSKELNASADLSANAVLSALSTILMNKDVHFLYEEMNWRLYVNVFILVAAPPGSRKDAVLKKVFSQVEKHQDTLIENHNQEMAGLESKINSLNKRFEKVSSLYAEKKNKDYQEEGTNILGEIKEFENKKRNKPIFLIGGDVTQEKIVELLSKNKEKLSISTAEGTELLSYFRGRYNNNSIDIFLKAWEGAQYTRYRMNSEEIRLVRPLLTLCLFTQPIELSVLKEFSGRGLAERFLISVPEKFPFKDVTLRNAMSKEVEESFHRNIQKIINSKFKRIVVGVSESAKELFESLYLKIFKEAYVADYPYSYQEWLLKVFGNIIKLITLLKVADAIIAKQDIENIYLDSLDLSKFQPLFDYYNSHYKKAFGIASNGYKEEDLEYLFRRILELEIGGKVSATDLNNNIRRFNSSTRVKLLNILEDHHFIKNIRRGRSVTTFINPKLLMIKKQSGGKIFVTTLVENMFK